MAKKPQPKKQHDDEELRAILDRPAEEKSAETDKQKLDKIRHDFMTLPEWADYPCRQCDCEDPEGCATMCKLWEAWWRLHFRRSTAEGKRIAANRDERKAKIARIKANENMVNLYESLAGIGIFGSDLENTIGGNGK